MSEEITVELGARRYPIHVGAGLIGQAGALLAPIPFAMAGAAVASDVEVVSATFSGSTESCAASFARTRARASTIRS